MDGGGPGSTCIYGNAYHGYSTITLRAWAFNKRTEACDRCWLMAAVVHRGIDPLHDDVIFWHDYNRSGTLTFKVKMADYHGIIVHRTPINPTMQSAAGLFWFLTSSCFRLIL